MTVIKVNLQAYRLNVYNKQNAGEHRDQCKLITYPVNDLVPETRSRAAPFHFPFGERGIEGASSCLSGLSPSRAKSH